MDDKRIEPRIEHSGDVTVKVQSALSIVALEGRVFPCQTADISLGGMRFQTDVLLPVGSLLELAIILYPTSQTYWHTGNVVWCKETDRKGQYEAGISFKSTINPQLDSWQRAIEKLPGKGEM